jgi:serine/threonine protein phosphatase PrpC
MTLQGEKGLGGSSVPNQDRSLALRVPNHLLLALFDGHGEQGHRAAAEVVRDLPFRILAATKQAKEQPPPATLEAEPVEVPGRQPNVVALPLSSHYTQAFLAADAGPVSKLQYAGTTGIVAHYDAEHQRLVLASVGDSTCLVVKGGGAGGVSPQILMESVKHKPGLPGERKRIESKGGRVFIPLDPVRESSRVLIPGPTGPDSYALAMSRSLGDAEGKELGYLTAEPDVRALELNGLYKQGDHVFVVVASDGVFDVINQQSLIQQLDQAFHSNLLTETCQKLMDEAAQGWNDLTGGIYRDDITLMVAKLPLR